MIGLVHRINEYHNDRFHQEKDLSLYMVVALNDNSFMNHPLWYG
jgi:hypothetical protein